MTARASSVEDDSQLLQCVLGAVRSLVLIVGADGIVQKVSYAVESSTGFACAAIGRPVWELAEKPTERDMLETTFGPAKLRPLPREVVFHLSCGAAGSRLVDWDVRMICDPRGGPIVILSGEASGDLLLQEKSARQEAELANARLLLLVTGSRQLSKTTSPGETLETLVRLVIPALADWSYVVHRGWNGGQRSVVYAHGDPNKERLLLGVLTESEHEGVSRVFRTGQSQVYPDITADDLAPGGLGMTMGGIGPDRRHALREAGMRSLLCVPIAGRTGVDAVLTLVSGNDPRRYEPDDVVLAEDLASRAAVALESGRLLFEALEAVRARDDFLSVAAHELRTPLTSLMLRVHSVDRAIGRDCPGSALAVRGVAGIQTQATRLSQLVDGLLDVVDLKSNRMTLRFEEVDLRQLVDGVLSGMAEDFQRAGCHLTASTPQGVTVRWDRFRIGQVLTNILTNAVKFGSGHPIEVRAETTPEKVRMSVRDHGPGIAGEDHARVFGRFERAVSTRNFGGLGLGLYISSQILRMHQGSLRVESEPGQGACFIVDLPRGLRPWQSP